MYRFYFIFLSFFLSFSAYAQFLHSNVDLGDLTYYENRGLSTDQIKEENYEHLDSFVLQDVETNKDDLVNDAPDYLSPKEAEDIYSLAKRHPVVALWQYEKYDPFDEGIGFCFGRAMFIHLELVQRGMDRDAIKKIFAIGPMNTSGGSTVEWGWHVATAVQSLDKNGKEKWLVIDPIFHRILDIYEWYEELREDFSTDDRLRVWMTSAGKFAPSSGSYDHDQIEIDFYNDYFVDLMQWFDKESQRGRYDQQVREYQP